MQPQTTVKFDEDSFKRIKKTIQNLSYAKRRSLENATLDLPAEVGLQLTNQCNLRCVHCFQWNEDGHHRKMSKEFQNAELPFFIVEKVFQETQESKSGFFLWGGEPMFYSNWDNLTYLLEKDPRWTVNCTNGILVEQKIDSLLRCSKCLVMLISVEGLEKENDVLRGKNMFNRVMSGIDTLLDLQAEKKFLGKISINCTIHDANVSKLYEITEFFEEKQIDTIYLNFPWYLPENIAVTMDKYFTEHFGYLNKNDQDIHSWHGYTFHLKESHINILEEEIAKINERKWNIRVRLQPALEKNEIRDFVIGERTGMDCKSYCAGMHTRMDVLTSGRVSTCKLFPEFELSSLETKSVRDIWRGDEFNRFRQIHYNNGLMPVCSKCIVLHLQGL